MIAIRACFRAIGLGLILFQLPHESEVEQQGLISTYAFVEVGDDQGGPGIAVLERCSTGGQIGVGGALVFLDAGLRVVRRISWSSQRRFAPVLQYDGHAGMAYTAEAVGTSIPYLDTKSGAVGEIRLDAALEGGETVRDIRVVGDADKMGRRDLVVLLARKEPRQSVLCLVSAERGRLVSRLTLDGVPNGLCVFGDGMAAGAQRFGLLVGRQSVERLYSVSLGVGGLESTLIHELPGVWGQVCAYPDVSGDGIPDIAWGAFTVIEDEEVLEVRVVDSASGRVTVRRAIAGAADPGLTMVAGSDGAKGGGLVVGLPEWDKLHGRVLRLEGPMLVESGTFSGVGEFDRLGARLALFCKGEGATPLVLAMGDSIRQKQGSVLAHIKCLPGGGLDAQRYVRLED